MHDYGDLRMSLLNNVISINIHINFHKFIITFEFWGLF
jgi:hypothetical protein